MASVRRVSAEAFRCLPLHAHAVLEGVALHDVTVVDLAGGGEGRSIADVQALVSGRIAATGGGITRSLFSLRRVLGRLFGWDHGPAESALSYRDRIPADLIARSVQMRTARRGPFETLYELETESLVEARNKTVHAFIASFLERTAHGYRLYWGVYVKPVSRFTALYMAAIGPFRRFIVYPSLLGGVARAWQARYGPAGRNISATSPMPR